MGAIGLTQTLCNDYEQGKQEGASHLTIGINMGVDVGADIVFGKAGAFLGTLVLGPGLGTVAGVLIGVGIGALFNKKWNGTFSAMDWTKEKTNKMVRSGIAESKRRYAQGCVPGMCH